MKSGHSALCIFVVLLSLSLAPPAKAMDLQLPGETAGPMLLLTATHPAQAAVVTTQSGQIRGVSADATGDVTVYRGIPYAAPPTGALRWREPQPPAAWSGIRDASAAVPGCMQIVAPNQLPWTEEFMHHGPVSEDCLYLNLWTPAHSAADRSPSGLPTALAPSNSWCSASIPRCILSTPVQNKNQSGGERATRCSDALVTRERP